MLSAPEPASVLSISRAGAYELAALLWSDLDLEHIRFHALRHTFATMALQSGVDIRTVSGMLGHADPGFTLRTYTHTTNPMQVQAAETPGAVMAQKL